MPMAMRGMPGPAQGWPGAAASFVLMWTVMMAAMMLPSFGPVLWRYRREVRCAGEVRRGVLTAIVGAGYLLVWTTAGAALFPLGLALGGMERRFPPLVRIVPVIAGAVVVIAGVLQFTRWKAHHLACCRVVPRRRESLRADARTAWRLGLRLGIHCLSCSAGMTAVLLAIGLMDLRVMAVVTAAITLERLAPAAERVARTLGGAAVAAGLMLVARAVGL